MDSRDNFPFDGAQCEGCGYPLKGLQLSGDCPECGKPVLESHYRHRPGLTWQNQVGVRSFVKTALAVGLSPRRAFRSLKIGGPNVRDRCFLFLFAITAGGIWTAVWAAGRMPLPLVWGVVVTAAIIAMTYVESLGVLYAGRHRGWRASWALSERVCCYSGVGWLPAALIGVKMAMLDQMNLLAQWWPQALGGWSNWHRFFVLVVVACIGMLAFETLVWVGIDQTRWGNSKPPASGENGSATGQ